MPGAMPVLVLLATIISGIAGLRAMMAPPAANGAASLGWLFVSRPMFRTRLASAFRHDRAAALIADAIAIAGAVLLVWTVRS